MQNVSHAVMAQRHEAKDSRDDFPTPPWATRALLEHVINDEIDLSLKSCLEPACGVGHMAKVLKEYFEHVDAGDIYNYGYGGVSDYLSRDIPNDTYDWVITNPPFRLAEEFVVKSLEIAKSGVAILARTVFIESIGRYERLFNEIPPSIFAQFAERVPMVKGRLDQKASTATGYCWIIWRKPNNTEPRLVWIPPCRRKLELTNDYDVPEIANADQLDLMSA